MPDPNFAMLQQAATKLGRLVNEVVFIGGVTLGLLISDDAAAPIRGTRDVDVIAEIITYADYVVFSERLRREHFTEDMSEEPLACRWHHGELTLDVMPIRKEVLGYANTWYEGALETAVAIDLPGGQAIRVISAPFFLGTKMEAFRGRGKMDYQASHDLEDFIAVIEGRPTVLEEITRSPVQLRRYLAVAASLLLNESRFLDVLPGYVLDDGRVPLILQRLTAIAQLGATS